MAKKEEGFITSVKKERKKIQWPDKSTTLEYALLVIVISAITAVLIWILDRFIFANLVNFLIKL
ncbi:MULTISPECIES: preprotein translocase subunit SecE [Anaerococcus]|uniref:Protein translocase subunit SecE n=1 Tax=Anaerococcus nagyae TaxID=1755241 RepID=A0A3E2TK29_9FIRM|nr:MULTISPECIES: preprotein translocase subunit SecE [Anaerococcus]MBP2069466.1 preprotein translocase subunit SecE [Anaerococcus nagyae]MDU1829350.1 preprotein translocase subunit SecE [Anaerococcus sp.]MDU1865258.1 preprotein translocase subunit SecE [Anaerococcus sp.]MDU2354196.1 preprotein translocase subunit SecE [Anaerococcus sp.]MDU2566602.1 preprotein translocase subunit SecE [Anaerococcus sp.]